VCRYKSLSVLQLPWISQARAITLARAFVLKEPLPTVQQLSQDEAFATPKELLQPKITTNATLRDLEAAAERLQASSSTFMQPNGNSNSPSHFARNLGTGFAADVSSRALNGASNGNGALQSSSSSPLQQVLEMYGTHDYVLLPCAMNGAVHALLCV
jgi:hypothetical protein